MCFVFVCVYLWLLHVLCVQVCYNNCICNIVCICVCTCVHTCVDMSTMQMCAMCVCCLLVSCLHEFVVCVRCVYMCYVVHICTWVCVLCVHVCWYAGICLGCISNCNPGSIVCPLFSKSDFLFPFRWHFTIPPEMTPLLHFKKMSVNREVSTCTLWDPWAPRAAKSEVATFFFFNLVVLALIWVFYVAGSCATRHSYQATICNRTSRATCHIATCHSNQATIPDL